MAAGGTRAEMGVERRGGRTGRGRTFMTEALHTLLLSGEQPRADGALRVRLELRSQHDATRTPLEARAAPFDLAPSEIWTPTWHEASEAWRP
jgi:hypothetical protein